MRRVRRAGPLAEARGAETDDEGAGLSLATASSDLASDVPASSMETIARAEGVADSADPAGRVTVRGEVTPSEQNRQPT